MESLMSAETAEKVRQMLEGMTEPVEILYFTQELECGACAHQAQIVREVAALSPKLSVKRFDFVKDAAFAKQIGIEKIPATVIRRPAPDSPNNIRFFGVTGGYEFTSFLETILMVSTGESGLDDEMRQSIRAIDRPVHIQVMVTLTCPYCPGMVHIGQQFAMENPNITGDMVDASEFPELVQKYQVKGVPRTVINETGAIEGAAPPEKVLFEIVSTVYPELASRLRQQPATSLESNPGRIWDAVVVGAGPAAMNAAIYAARKNMTVAMIGDHPGGQITDTADVENWLGIPHVGGQQLAALFLDHVRQYPVALHLSARVDSVRNHQEGFELHLSDGMRVLARSVIYCAGKKYRRLNVPGEAKFIGSGIAFCATCDAPLFKNRKVAVVGGGNSAFTAARDLLDYASQIHILHVLDEFQADPKLVEQVLGNENVFVHKPVKVVEFMGEASLSAVRLEHADGAISELPVDGVFLEIGLEPNTDPVRDVVRLNDDGEVRVNRDGSTAVPGFFAAGDVTDMPEKQIITAAGDGARAALAAHRYIKSLPR